MAHRVSSIAVLAMLAGLTGMTPSAQGHARQPLPVTLGSFGREMPSWRAGLLARGAGLPRPARGLNSSDSWNIEPTPNPASRRNASLASESCTGPADCTAVGSFVDASGTTVALAERWDGSGWHAQPAAHPVGAVYSVFTGVSCAVAGACEAVGYYFTGAGEVLTLAEARIGRRWHIQTMPSLSGIGSGLFAVSCSADRECTAVGVRDNSAGTSLTLAERWDGTSWSVQATPISIVPVPSTLLGVSCSGAQACTAVGALDNSAGITVPLAMSWNGTIWTVQATVIPARAVGSGFSGVACTTAGVCTAAGSYDTPTGSTVNLAERWNGTSWSRQVVPGPRGAATTALLAVSCGSASACVAVGEYGTGGGATGAMTEAWDGSRWRIEAAASPADSTISLLSGVSCTAPRACDAIGSFGTSVDPSSQALAEAWNGARWALQPSHSPDGANASELSTDSCTSSRACTAVGLYVGPADVIKTLAEVRTARGWRIQATPNPRGASVAAFAGVSCSSARTCTAVGQETTASGANLGLAEARNGSRWTIQSVPNPVGNSGVLLNAVSCYSPRACMAAGYYYDAIGTPTALIERWDGVSWQILAIPKAARQTWLLGVSCPSARHCTAVGYENDGVGNNQPLAEAWNGTTWRVQRVRLPAGSAGGTLASVSCTSPTACMATGASLSDTGAPLAERWNGTRWSAEATVAPLDHESSTSQIVLLAVSCRSARTCAAVGDYAPNTFSATFAETWDGKGWSLRLTAAPEGTVQSLLTGVSCADPTCTAVGGDVGQSGTLVTLAEVADLGY